MGNTCVGPSRNGGFLQSVSAAMWRPRDGDDSASVSNGGIGSEPVSGELRSTLSDEVQNKPPEQVTMPKPETNIETKDREIQPESKPEAQEETKPESKPEPIRKLIR